MRVGSSSRRRLLVPLAFVLVAVSGCTAFNAAPTGAQQDVIGDVRLHLDVCSDGFGDQNQTRGPGPSSCQSGSHPPFNSQPTGQLLVGLLIPGVSPAPAGLSSDDLPGVSFAPDADYSTYLQDRMNAPEGSRWVGYRSGTIDETGQQPISVRIDVDLDVPDDASIAYHAQSVIGDRFVGDVTDPGTGATTTLSADRPLDCGDGHSACSQDSGDVDVTTRALRLDAGDGGTLEGGDTVTVPFDAVFGGDNTDASATFALSASSTVPGGTVTLDRDALTPASDSTTSEPVTVDVPKDTPAGAYTVTLTAAVGEQTRTATAHLDVAAATPVQPSEPVVPTPPAPLPMLTNSLGQLEHPSLRTLFAGGARVQVGCNQSCLTVVDLVVYRNATYKHAAGIARVRRLHPTPVLVGRRYVNLDAAGTQTPRTKLFPEAARVLRHIDHFRLIVATTSFNARGHHRTTQRYSHVVYRNVCAHTHVKVCVRGSAHR